MIALRTFGAWLPNGIPPRSDTVYWSPRGYLPLAMDVYLPRGEVRRCRPALLFIHGGSWIAGELRSLASIRDFPQILEGIAARGYDVAALDYGLSSDAKWPAQERNVKSAICFPRASAPEFGVDPERIDIWGVSAGGQLAAVAATT